MPEIPEDMEQTYARPDSLTSLDTHYCPGCTHGTTHRLIAEVLDELGVREKTVGIAPVGACHNWHLVRHRARHGNTLDCMRAFTCLAS